MIPSLPGIPGTSNRTALYIVAAVCAVLVALLAGGWWGWTRGYASAENKLQAEYSANLAQATREAALKQQAETVRANGLAAQLITTKRSIEAERSSLRGRIVHATREVPADCGLPAGAVRLWNQAWGLPAADLPQAAGTGGAAGQAAAPGSAGAGVQPVATLADALAWVIDAGTYCRQVEAQRDQFQELVKGWAQ